MQDNFFGSGSISQRHWSADPDPVLPKCHGSATLRKTHTKSLMFPALETCLPGWSGEEVRGRVLARPLLLLLLVGQLWFPRTGCGPPPTPRSLPPSLLSPARGVFITGCCSVADPDPDPHVFEPPGSGSTSQRYGSGSGSGSFYHHAKIVRKTLIPTILWLFLTFYLWKMM
jgi:hypothetical protein